MAEQSGKHELKDWHSYWDAGLTPWHEAAVQDRLASNMDLLTGGKSDMTFLIPLCGATLDLKYLYDLGHKVIGTECSEKACRKVFEAEKMEYDVADNLSGNNGFKVFKVWQLKI